MTETVIVRETDRQRDRDRDSDRQTDGGTVTGKQGPHRRRH